MQPSLTRIHDQGGVPIEVVGPARVLPASPHDNDTFNWPTDRLEIGTKVEMRSGASWRVSRPPVRLSNARVRLVFRQPGRKLSAAFNVPADAISEPIWNVGQPLPAEIDVPPSGQVTSTNPAPVRPTNGPSQPIPGPSDPPTGPNRPGAVVTLPDTPGRALGTN